MNCTPEEMERAEAAYEAAHADEIEAMEKWAAEEEAKREALLKKYNGIDGVSDLIGKAKQSPSSFPTEFLEYCMAVLDQMICALYDDPYSKYAPCGEFTAEWRSNFRRIEHELEMRRINEEMNNRHGNHVEAMDTD